MTLEWHDKRTDERGYCSRCGRYSVSSKGEGANERWETWRMVPGGAWFAPIAVSLMSESEARLAAELDVESRVA